MKHRTFHLLPEPILARVRTQRASRRVVGISASIAIVTVGLVAFATWVEARSRSILAAAQREGAPVIAIEQEIEAYRQTELQLLAALERQRTVGNSIPAHGVIKAVAGSLPSGAVVKRLMIRYDNVQGSNKRVRRNAKEVETPPRMLVCELEGIALDDAGVNAIVQGLERLESLSKVTLESSRSYLFRGKSAREYKVTFSADLERRWRLPVVADASFEGGNP